MTEDPIRKILARLCFVLLLGSFLSCKESSDKNFSAEEAKRSYELITGTTMGTYYRITANCIDYSKIQSSIDSLLLEINSAVSTYEPESFIAQINASKAGTPFDDYPEHFDVNLRSAQNWYEQSEGYLDVSIMPLVNHWGFGYHEKRAVTEVDSTYVEGIFRYIGLNKWKIDKDGLSKTYDEQQLDFSALAKGYAVDQVGELLVSKGCSDFLIDVGGEYVAKGLNAKGAVWTIGLSTPSPDAKPTDVELAIKLDNQALASSGNYRNYHEVDGKKYGHTLDPKTGYPYQDELLGVTIITDQCIDADAIATACMAMGYRKAVTFIDQLPDVSACFLIGDDKGTITSKFANGFIRSVIQ